MKVRLARLGVLFVMSISLFVCAITSTILEKTKVQPSENTISSEEKIDLIASHQLDLIQRPMLMVASTANANIPLEPLSNLHVYVEETSPNIQEFAETTEEIIVKTSKQPIEEKITENSTQEIVVEESETSPEKETIKENVEEHKKWDGEILDSYIGTVQGPSGKETYYDLPMQGVINIMEDLGYIGEEWYFWIREDGVKMYGQYIMCAANLEIRPKGTIIETSLGTAMVCDTGTFAKYNKYQLDIATDWTDRNGY